MSLTPNMLPQLIDKMHARLGLTCPLCESLREHGAVDHSSTTIFKGPVNHHQTIQAYHPGQPLKKFCFYHNKPATGSKEIIL